MLPSNGIKDVHRHWQDEDTHQPREAADDESTHRCHIAPRHHTSTSSFLDNMYDLPTQESEDARTDREFRKFFDFNQLGGLYEPDPDIEERVC